MNRQDLGKYFNELGFKIGAEIGVAAGHFSQKLCEDIPGLKLYCVDSWMAYHGNRRGGADEKHNNNFIKTKNRLKGYNVEFLRMFSMDALKYIPDESLDFVFIDANHDYSFVKEDIREWSKKVRKGGIISGHDYYNMRNGGVVQAVDEYVKENGIELHLTDADHLTRDDKEPSYYWFKK